MAAMQSRSIAEQHADDPGPCQTLITEVALSFSLVKGGPVQLDEDATALPDYRTRVKAALAARANQVCPFAAAMMGFEQSDKGESDHGARSASLTLHSRP